MLASGVVGQVPVLAKHLPLKQQPAVHEPPAQHMSPSPPHLAQTPPLLLLQAVPAMHCPEVLLAGQQASPV